MSSVRDIGDVILDLQNISLSFGGVKALTDISFDVREHEIRAIIGPNGAGKSSMLNVINGVYRPQQGTITYRGKQRRDMDTYADTRRTHAEYLMATQSVAMATQNLLLSAHALGLGACWMCAPLFVPETVRETLHLDADWEPQALITLGYPAEEKIKTRNVLTSQVKYLDADKRG